MKEPGTFIYIIDLSGPNAQKIAKYMYESEGIRMSRKNNIALRLIAKDIKPCVRHAPKGMRWCSRCKTFKNKNNGFYSGKRLSICILCNREKSLAYYHSKRSKEKAKVEIEVSKKTEV